jgi:small multidrug resistance family-3 protein
MFELRTLLLFVLTAFAEIAGCYLVYLWLKQAKSAWLLLPAAICLGAFAWLLSLHPAAAGRVYAAYGGVYVATAILWLWWIEGIRPSSWDLLGSAVALIGMGIIMFAPRQA